MVYFQKLIQPFYYLFLIILTISNMSCSVLGRDRKDNDTMKNKKIIRQGFEKWAGGEANFFDLLAEDAVWTITGNSPVSKTYSSRKQFMDEVIRPLNQRLQSRIVPDLKGLYAEDDMVIALWEGKATATDGKPYNNMYSWYMKMKGGKIVNVIAFFDTIEFTDIWERVNPSAIAQ